MRPPAAPGPHYISPAALCVHLLLHRRPIYYFSGASRDMLICGRCNPPPVDDPNYRGPYFDSKDDMQAHASSMRVRLWLALLAVCGPAH